MAWKRINSCLIFLFINNIWSEWDDQIIKMTKKKKTTKNMLNTFKWYNWTLIPTCQSDIVSY